jgi:small subunit ribosomal protein S6
MTKGGNMAIYETVVIVDSLLPPKEIDDLVDHFSHVIKEHGGKVRTVDKWGKRRLAYEIQKKQYGFYFTIEFEGPGDIPLVLQSEYNFNDNVLRYLTYLYDKHKIKAMAQQPALKKAVVAEEGKAEPVAEKVKESAEEIKDEQE